MVAPLLLGAFDGQRAAVQRDQPFGNRQPQSQPLLLMHPAVELHVSANAGDLLGEKIHCPDR